MYLKENNKSLAIKKKKNNNNSIHHQNKLSSSIQTTVFGLKILVYSQTSRS